ncbi:endospore germination permease [Clostridium sp. D2Q-11]|uniref:Endospore germination permease n=1 Tax=Anaeromonas frigoriresistens TaxID=2683708 RepID=A0A942Z9H7_9FIRM|nr:endospore germination permease [Anaeromonas frigoriresistens]MBS4539333.1 endospore germination permease [Anaeromonas frigoriresistens]
MLNKIQISNKQLIILMTGFLLGDALIINPVSGAGRDAWISIILTWLVSYILIGMYVYIAKLNPNKTLVEILIDIFGDFFGRALSLIYIWYFLHLSSLVLRSYSEYMIIANYPETPLIYMAILSSIPLAIGLKYGMEAIGRTGIIVSLIIPITLIISTMSVIDHIDITNLQPILKYGIKPVLKSSFNLLTFPFGEGIVFLMVFPLINKKENLFKSSFISVSIVGVIFLLISLRNITVLGENILERGYFSSHLIETIHPGAIFDPFISVSQLILAALQIWIFLYALLIAISQMFNFNDYKPFVFPIVIISVSLSHWIYDNAPDMFRVAKEIYPFYAIPFQFIIPIIILVISLIKQRRSKGKVSE